MERSGVDPFAERDALDPERVNRCCYGITDTEGVFSFCAFNNLYRFPTRTSARTISTLDSGRLSQSGSEDMAKDGARNTVDYSEVLGEGL